jgi:hypothetical protein
MKYLIIAASIFAAAAPALAETNVSIWVGQPNFFGRIELGGGYAPPPVVYSQPIIVDRRYDGGAPVYLRVPDGDRRHWDRACNRYNACGQRVLFVQDGWYNNFYAPRYREEHRHDGERDYRGDHRGHDNGHHDHDRGHDHGGDHGDHGDHGR